VHQVRVAIPVELNKVHVEYRVQNLVNSAKRTGWYKLGGTGLHPIADLEAFCHYRVPATSPLVLLCSSEHNVPTHSPAASEQARGAAEIDKAGLHRMPGLVLELEQGTLMVDGGTPHVCRESLTALVRWRLVLVADGS
jgi:hypothetical protein